MFTRRRSGLIDCMHIHIQNFMNAIRNTTTSLLAATCLFAMKPVLYADTVDIVRDGKPQAAIVVPAEPAEMNQRLRGWTTMDAAVVLRDYIQRSTGAKLPIVREDESAPGGNVILLGHTGRARDALGIDPHGLPGEGYRIKAFDGGVAIVGEIDDDGVDRGTLFGVYDFLERFADVRWYFPGEIGTIVPSRESITVPVDFDIDNQPYFEVRVGGISHWAPELAREWHPALRFGTRKGLVANHTHEAWPDIYGESNPEYFGIRADGTKGLTDARARSGQSLSFLCHSEPGLLRQHVKNVDEYFRTGDTTPWRGGVGPRGNNIPFGPSDTREFCHCESCKAEHTPERGFYGRSSNLHMNYVRKYAEEVAKRHPDAVIWTLAYDHYQQPPTNIDRLPDNVGVTLVMTPSITSQAYPAIDEENRQLIADWFELVGRDRERLIIWDFFVYPHFFFLAPTEIPNLYQDMVGLIRDKSLGMFNNGFNFRGDDGRTARRVLTYRMVWLMHQLLWNPDMDMDQARRDWSHDLFGPAGDDMEAFYKLLEDRWENAQWDQRPFRVAVSERSVYQLTYPPDVVAELKRMLDAALSKTEAGTAYRKRLEWFIDKAYEPFFQECAKHHRASGEIPVHKARRVVGVPEQDIEAFWGKIQPSLTTRENVTGEDVEDESTIKVAYDENYLYVYAQLEFNTDDDADSARAATGGAMEGQMATGEVGSSVNQGDMFVIHFKPDNADGYLELAVDTGTGLFSSGEDVMQIRGFNTSHTAQPWNAENVSVTAFINGNVRTLVIAIPWDDIPGIGEGAPERLRTQFIRWDRSYRHRFTSWVTTQSTWDYTVARFGWLDFTDAK